MLPAPVMEGRQAGPPAYIGNGRMYRAELTDTGDQITLFGQDVVTIERV